MAKNWLTTKTLGSISSELNVKTGVIEKIHEDTSVHVNTLLAQERLSYIYSMQDNSLIDIVPEWETAFSYDETYLDLDDWEKIIWISESFEQKWHTVIYDWVKFSKDSLKDRKVSVVVKNEYVLDTKEWIFDTEYISFYDAQKRKRYVLKKHIKHEYSDTDVKDMSIMEVTGLANHNINMKFIAWYFPGFKIPSEEFFTYMNEQFSYAVRFLEKRAPILASRKPFQTIKDLSFHSEQEILDFLKMVKSEDRRQSITACTLIKFIFLLHKYRENPIFTFWEKCQESDEFMIAYIRKIFHLPWNIKIKKDSKWVFHFTKIFPEFSNAEIPITFRVKSLDSILHKSLSSASYLLLEDFRDIFASTTYIPEQYKSRTVQIMQQFDTHITQWDAYVKNKWFLNDDNVSPKAAYKYRKAKWNIKRWTSSSDTFTDAKQTWEHLVDFEYAWERYEWKIGIENRFLYGSPSKDVNETWLTCHPVYEYFAKHFEWEQNRAPFYTVSNIAKLFDDFFDYLSETLEDKYPELDLWQVMSDIYNELLKVNDIAHFPWKKCSKWALKDFYHSKMKVNLFKHFALKFKLQRASYWKELVFISDENRHQLKVWGRWYKLK